MTTVINQEPFEREDFSGGIQRKTIKFMRKANEVVMAVNASFGRIGGVEKILGMAKLGGDISATDYTVTNLHGINFADGITEKIHAFRGGAVVVYNPSTKVWDTVAGVSFNAAAFMDSANFLDYAFFVNGVEANYSYSSGDAWSATTNLGDDPIAKYIRNHKVRLYLGNVKINSTWYRSRVWYSDFPKNNQITWGLETGTDLSATSGSAVVTSAGSTFETNNIKVGNPFTIEDGNNAGEYKVRTIDSETQITLTKTLANTEASKTFWVGGNFFDVRTDDGDVITGFGENSNEILVFKRLSLHRYNAQAGTLRQVKNIPGTGSFRSVIDLNDFTYYYEPSKSAVRRFDGSSSIIISNPIEDLLENISSSMRDKVVGWDVNERAEMFIGDTTTRDGESISNCVVVWDTITETWSTRSLPFEIEAATKWIQSGKKDTYLGTSDSKVIKADSGYSYAGTAMAFELTDQPLFPQGKDIIVNFDRIRVWIKNGHAIQLLYKLFYMPGDGTSWGNSDWIPVRGKADAELTEFSLSDQELRRAAGIQIRFVQSSSEESFVLERYKIYFSNPAIE